MSVVYISFLLLSLCCMVICDHRWKLAFFFDAKRAALLSVLMVGLFVVWDAFGIAQGVFFRGDSPYMLGVELAPEMPVEEPIFLFFLTYLTINLTSGARLILQKLDSSGGENAA
ncbi:lycopene cyclase domain-containing protein [Corynebacterium urogenitale]